MVASRQNAGVLGGVRECEDDVVVDPGLDQWDDQGHAKLVDPEEVGLRRDQLFSELDGGVAGGPGNSVAAVDEQLPHLTVGRMWVVDAESFPLLQDRFVAPHACDINPEGARRVAGDLQLVGHHLAPGRSKVPDRGTVDPAVCVDGSEPFGGAAGC